MIYQQGQLRKERPRHISNDQVFEQTFPIVERSDRLFLPPSESATKTESPYVQRSLQDKASCSKYPRNFKSF